MKLLPLLLLLILLTACSKSQPTNTDISGELSSCTVFSDKISCTLNNGNSMYANQLKIALVTKYDQSAWKENQMYCPINITPSEQCRNMTQKYCYNGNSWISC